MGIHTGRCMCPVNYTEDMFNEFKQKAAAEVGKWTLLRFKDPDLFPEREHFKDLYPFRVPMEEGSTLGCPRRANVCCGGCVRKCDSRCVQDMYTKLNILYESEWQKAEYIQVKHPTESSIRAYKRPTYLMQLIDKTLTDPELTYKKLMDFFNDLQRGGLLYELNYTPQTLYEYVSETSGRAFKKVNKQTGDVAILYWPESGLCPYCVPNVTAVARYARRPKKNGSID